MEQQEKEMKKYIHSIAVLLVGKTKARRRFLENYESHLWDVLEETGMAYTSAQLAQRFGEPDIIAEEYASVFQEEYELELQKQRQKRLLIGSICILIVFLCVLLVWHLSEKSLLHYIGGYFVKFYN